MVEKPSRARSNDGYMGAAAAAAGARSPSRGLYLVRPGRAQAGPGELVVVSGSAVQRSAAPTRRGPARNRTRIISACPS